MQNILSSTEIIQTSINFFSFNNILGHKMVELIHLLLLEN